MLLVLVQKPPGIKQIHGPRRELFGAEVPVIGHKGEDATERDGRYRCDLHADAPIFQPPP